MQKNVNNRKKFKNHRGRSLFYWDKRMKPVSFYKCQKVSAKREKIAKNCIQKIAKNSKKRKGQN